MGKGEKRMILGVTGGIAAGKSTVVEEFRRLGAEVVSADQLSRDAVRPGSPALQKIVERFGREVLFENGERDRDKMARIVFNDPAARQELEKIVHPEIEKLARRELAAASRRAQLVVYEAPLLFERGAQRRVDRVLAVTVAQDEQLRRLMARDNLSGDAARNRIAAQMPQDRKAALADFVIDNTDAPEQTRAQVRSLYRQLTGGGPDSPAR